MYAIPLSLSVSLSLLFSFYVCVCVFAGRIARKIINYDGNLSYTRAVAGLIIGLKSDFELHWTAKCWTGNSPARHSPEFAP